MYKPLTAITLSRAQDTMTIMLWHHQLHPCPPVLPSPVGPHLLSVLLVFILTAMLQMYKPLAAITPSQAQDTVVVAMLWHHQLRSCPPVLPSPLGPRLLSALLVFILTAMLQMFLSW